MSDDLWRPGRDDDFGDLDDDWDDIPSAPALPQRERPTDFSGPVLSFGADTAAAMPHWSEPPTGEVPRLFADREPTEDLDVWSSFSTGSSAPTWRDDPDATRVNVTGGLTSPRVEPRAATPSAAAPSLSDDDFPPLFDPVPLPPAVPAARSQFDLPERPSFAEPSFAEPGLDETTFGIPVFADSSLDDLTFAPSRPGLSGPTGFDDDAGFGGGFDGEPTFADTSAAHHADTPAHGIPVVPDAPTAREPIRIGTDAASSADRSAARDSTGGNRRPSEQARRPRPATPPGPPMRGRPAPAPKGGAKGRDMPTAIALGFGLAVVFVAIVQWVGRVGVLALVVVVLGLAAIEFFGRVTERGYRPATIPGIVACALAPVAAYHYGERGIAVTVFLAMVATVITAMSADGVESGPLPNTAVTLVGVVWIGVLGSYAGLILAHREPYGTDTIFALVIGVVANDVGALFLGSTAGRTPLREWISPNKTIEGLIGGTIATLGAMLFLHIMNSKAQTWQELTHVLVLGLAIAILAPIGDLTESMFKRNLEIKDFGTLLPGHGGVLDRFDGFLFVLPAAYYVLTWLQPYLPVVPVG